MILSKQLSIPVKLEPEADPKIAIITISIIAIITINIIAIITINRIAIITSYYYY